MVIIVVVISVGSRMNKIENESIYNDFADANVVAFNCPTLDQLLNYAGISVDIDVIPTRINSLYVKTWYLYLENSIEEELISFNNNYHSVSSFKIEESIYLRTENTYNLILVINCYYNDNNYQLNTTNQFIYQR